MASMWILARMVLEAGYVPYAHWRRAAALAAVPLVGSFLFEFIGVFGSSYTGISNAAYLGLVHGAYLLSELALVPFMVAWHRFTFDGFAPSLGLGAREARYVGCLAIVMVASSVIGYPLLRLNHVLIDVIGFSAPLSYFLDLLALAAGELLFAIAAFLLVEIALGRGGGIIPALHATRGLRGRLFVLIVGLGVVEAVAVFPIEFAVGELVEYWPLKALLVTAGSTVVHVAVLSVLVSAMTLAWRDAAPGHRIVGHDVP